MALGELNIDKTDINREGFSFQKFVIQPLRVVFLKKTTEVLESVFSFSSINFKRHKDSGKKGIILDMDDCIAPHHGKTLPPNLIIIEDLVYEEWKIVVHSNMQKSDRYKELEAMGIEIITSKYAKPDPRGFEECLKSMNLTAKEVMMIGDNFLTDGGSIRAGIDFIKVRPIETEEKNPSVGRVVQKVMRSFADEVARVRGNI